MLSISLFILLDATTGSGELITWLLGILTLLITTLAGVYQHVNTREKKEPAPVKSPAETMKEMMEVMQMWQAMQSGAMQGGAMPYLPPPYPPPSQMPPPYSPPQYPPPGTEYLIQNP